ncbi:MAG TPA: endolytic transglycosylase MltG [Steroidobacteraceae bacterium]|nr:endolytic transglycosylase MltG [Steroidobacteraceae bacterium]
MRKLLLIVVVLVAIGGYARYRYITTSYTAPGPLTEVTRVEVPPGASVRAVITQLGKRGVLADARAVSLYLRVQGLSPKFKAGTYDFPAHATPAQVVQMLEQGNVVLEQLTVVEGSRFADFRRTLESHPAVQVTLRGKSDAEVMAAIGHPNEVPEGRFFPDTYRFAAHTTDVELLKLAYNSMQRVLEQAWAQRKEDLPIHTPYEALILASIVEKETALDSERALIAGVFTARLRRGMRLQTDPTVIYGLGQSYDGDIRTKDLQTDTPYNTYTRTGLPPTPIALPGRESVLAAVRPEETGVIYFVATGDGTGAHYFSKTLEEHNQAVRRYLARLRQRGTLPTHTTTQSEAR